ncbi:HET-domain-containing protein [Microthyrium microscopicum]|uniref:HET-domain-containing protein n=1 Tax=Microthyrium microscopicum TaxID=703497 RepID=A0A6A6UQI6_9PEZI|nr:HET-domain-containing protein [Microthyrium microscopicum]
MKSVFRKLKSRKKDDADRSGSASVISNASGKQPVPQPDAQQNSASSQKGGSNTLSVTSTKPIDQIGNILALPASSVAEDPREIIHINPPSICPICYNFDPYHAPPDGDAANTPWACSEYKIPQDTPIARIDVEKSEQLLEAAKAGCLYCVMVTSSLGAVQPGWENEKSFVHIFLAAGLPVIVRLQFGGTSTVTMTREQMLGMGVELPEGQTMNFVITVSDPEKPPIEVEIYRPIVPDDQITVADIAMSPLVQHVGFADEIPPHAGSQECFDFIKDKVGTCVKTHTCTKDGVLPMLPDRVLWVEANNSSRIQLLEPQSIRAPFMAVSYCWGPPEPNAFLTDAKTLEAKKAGIRFNDLPPLFQDIVSTARVLGIEYVWIDRLCIIQGDENDFGKTAPKMGDIYGNATLTIATASAVTENDRILVPRGEKWFAYDLKVNVNGLGALTLRFRRRAYSLGKESSGGEYGKISSRAWIWQERLLATRTVFFTDGALKFECRCHSFWEGFDRGLVGHSWSSQLDSMTHIKWTGLVEEYMGRDITRPSDRLPAMDAVMKRIERATGWTPFWGLWANALVESLSWQSKESSQSSKHECRMNPGHYAPTWSWASVDGPISYVSARPFSVMEENDPMQWDLECRSLNEASGLIRFAGHIILLELHCTVEPNILYDENPTGQDKYSYRYEVKGPTDLKGFPMKADVAVKPWSGTLNGEQVSTVIRVPYGETPPTQPWSSHCLCLLVGKRKMRSLVLFLGRSLRESGAWERIGMVDGISPAVFSLSQRQLIDVV